MTACPDCQGTGRVTDTPWTDWRGRLERNPENERDWPCETCAGEGVLETGCVASTRAVAEQIAAVSGGAVREIEHWFVIEPGEAA